MTKQKKTKPVELWAGFVSNKLSWTPMDDGWGGFNGNTRQVPCLFTSLLKAKEQFKDVRRVEIREIKP